MPFLMRFGQLLITGYLYFLQPSFGQEEKQQTLVAAAVQFHPLATVEENTTKIIEWIKQAAERKVQVVVFQECATTGYVKGNIASVTPESLKRAEARIAEACRQYHIHAVVGTPYHEKETWYNTAVVFDASGEEVDRYAKIQLVGGDEWASPGERMSVFSIDNIPCSIIICHDERYPELIRLPVLAGARLIFYVSSESGMQAEHKIEPYRAQIGARADENDVYIVHANSPAMHSHGQSRIIGPDGHILSEATMFGEEMVTAILDMSKATGNTAKKSLRSNLLRSWWEEGIKKVQVKTKPETP